MKPFAWLLLAGCGAGVHAPASTAPVVIRMERGGECFPAEVCASYTLTLHRDGVVEFDGKRDTKVRGWRRDTVDRKTMDELEARFARVFPDLRLAYPRLDCTDQAIVTLADKGQTIYHDYGDRTAPFDLFVIENLLDARVHSERWVGWGVFISGCMPDGRES